MVPVMSPNDTKAPPVVLKRIRCNCKGELCIFVRHATPYSKQVRLDWLAHEATWESQSDLTSRQWYSLSISYITASKWILCLNFMGSMSDWFPWYQVTFKQLSKLKCQKSHNLRSEAESSTAYWKMQLKSI